MRALPAITPSTLLGACLGGLALAFASLPATAQGSDAEPESRWTLEGLQWGTCLEFLVNPEHSRKLLPSSALPIRADASQLVPALARVVADQPEYAGWSPASFCFFAFDAIHVGGRRVSGDKDATGPVLGVLSIAARQNGPLGEDADVAHKVVTTSWQVEKSAERTRSAVNLQVIRGAFGTAPRGTDDRYVLRVGKTTITWNGHPASDSVAAAPFKRSYVAEGGDDKPWRLDFSVSALSQRSMVGAVIVQGKDDLAKALGASPIRFVGPFYQGGSGEIALVR